jgi:hypothetical protein
VAQNPKRQVRADRTRAITFELGVVVLALILFFEADARAYVDPGTGSYLFQLAIAGGLAGIYTLRRYWQTLTNALRTRFRRTHDDPPSPGRHDVE